MSIVTVAAVCALTIVVGGGLGYVARNEWLRRAGRIPPPREAITRVGLTTHGVFVAALFGGLAATILGPRSWPGAWIVDLGFGPFFGILIIAGTLAQLILMLLGYPSVKRNPPVKR